MFLAQDARRYADPSYQPLALVRWIVRWPAVVAGLSLAVALLFAVGSSALAARLRDSPYWRLFS